MDQLFDTDFDQDCDSETFEADGIQFRVGGPTDWEQLLHRARPEHLCAQVDVFDAAEAVMAGIREHLQEEPRDALVVGLTRLVMERRTQYEAFLGTDPGGKDPEARRSRAWNWLGVWDRWRDFWRLRHGHTYLDKNGDGVACESLR